jgi:hypothetical protein
VPGDEEAQGVRWWMRVSYRPAAKWAAFANLLLEPAHFIMGRRQLLGVRQRAEATGQAATVLR